MAVITTFEIFQTEQTDTKNLSKEIGFGIAARIIISLGIMQNVGQSILNKETDEEKAHMAKEIYEYYHESLIDWIDLYRYNLGHKNDKFIYHFAFTKEKITCAYFKDAQSYKELNPHSTKIDGYCKQNIITSIVSVQVGAGFLLFPIKSNGFLLKDSNYSLFINDFNAQKSIRDSTVRLTQNKALIDMFLENVQTDLIAAAFQLGSKISRISKNVNN